jgi:hypothetical protein
MVRHMNRYNPSKPRHGKPNYQKTALSASEKTGELFVSHRDFFSATATQQI